jgi:hypothetical protein
MHILFWLGIFFLEGAKNIQKIKVGASVKTQHGNFQLPTSNLFPREWVSVRYLSTKHTCGLWGATCLVGWGQTQPATSSTPSIENLLWLSSGCTQFVSGFMGGGVYVCMYVIKVQQLFYFENLISDQCFFWIFGKILFKLKKKKSQQRAWNRLKYMQ